MLEEDTKEIGSEFPYHCIIYRLEIFVEERVLVYMASCISHRIHEATF